MLPPQYFYIFFIFTKILYKFDKILHHFSNIKTNNMHSIKIIIALLFMNPLFIMAQKDTTYYNSKGKEVKNKTLASYFRVVSTKNIIEIWEEFDMSGKKESYYMYKKLPIRTDALTTTGEKRSKKNAQLDSAMVKHGTFVEWDSLGEAKLRGTYFAGKFQGSLETFHPNGKPKRQDVYALDTLKSGHCFDSLGTEITYFPYYVQPEYEGGIEGLFRFLASNVRYPAYARERGIEGTVYVGFIVEKDGSVVEFDVKKGVHKALDDESIRVAGLMPKWTAGKLDGKKARVAYTLPIKFKLE
jgi:TonB family protein